LNNSIFLARQWKTVRVGGAEMQISVAGCSWGVCFAAITSSIVCANGIQPLLSATSKVALHWSGMTVEFRIFAPLTNEKVRLLPFCDAWKHLPSLNRRKHLPIRMFSSPCSHLFPTNINLVAKIMLAIVGVWLVSNGPAAICIVVFLQTFARDSLCNITFIPVSTWQLYNAPFDSLKKKPSSSRIFFHFFILEAEVYHKIWL